MRVVYLPWVKTKLDKIIGDAINDNRQIEYIYLDSIEWEEIHKEFGKIYNWYVNSYRVAIQIPGSVVYIRDNTIPPTMINNAYTYEFIYHGVKIRKEY